MATLYEDVDNFSVKNSRGTRYNIYANGELVYRGVSEQECDRLCEQMEAKPYLYEHIVVKEL